MMQNLMLNRRGFIATVGALGAAAAAGAALSGESAFAENYAAAGDFAQASTLCDGCKNRCGLIAYTLDGALDRCVGQPYDAAAAGSLCAAGYAAAQVLNGEGRVTKPLKKTEKGDFKEIAWDEAFAAIGEALGAATASKVAYISNGDALNAEYGKRLMEALGSANVYTDDASYGLAYAAGSMVAIGFPGWTSDVANSKMTLYVGEGSLDGMSPAQQAALQQGFQAGANIVMALPRFANQARLASKWLPINPGSELALVLALSHEIANSRYDNAFVAAQGSGFAQYKDSLETYTAEWAAGITGLDAGQIKAVAEQLYQAAPAVSVTVCQPGACGAAQANGGELARAAALLNAMLGCYNQQGGALVHQQAAKPMQATGRVGDSEYALAALVGGSAQAALHGVENGSVEAVILCGTKLVDDSATPEALTQAIGKCDLSVCIDSEFSQTAWACQYVLPAYSVFERDGLPQFVDAPIPYVALASQAVSPQGKSDAKALGQIMDGIANAAKLGTVSFDEKAFAASELADVDVAYEDVCNLGAVPLVAGSFPYGTTPAWGTPSGWVEFASPQCKQAGLDACPQWTETAQAADGELLLSVEALPFSCQGAYKQVESVKKLVADNGLDQAQINAEDAAKLGVSTGDTIALTTTAGTLKVPVVVTQTVIPGAISLPIGLFGKEKKQSTAAAQAADVLVELGVLPAYGAATLATTAVSVKKAGA